MADGLEEAPTENDHPVPVLGIVFDTLSDGVKFYKTYATSHGFGTRLGTQKGTRDHILMKYVTCSREGVAKPKKGRENEIVPKRRTITTRCRCKAMISLKRCPFGLKFMVAKIVTEHNHTLFEDREYARALREMTVGHKQWMMTCRQSGMGPVATHKLCTKFAGGSVNVGASSRDFMNFNRDLKIHIGKDDVQMVITDFQAKVSAKLNFYYSYDTDGDGKLTRLFWCDGISRQNYERYGDALSIDATYDTNKYSLVYCPFTGLDNHNRCVTFAAGLISREDGPSDAWLLCQFMHAMKRKKPNYIVSDQDLGLKNALEEELPEVPHRLCMWHIMDKLAKHVTIYCLTVQHCSL